MKTAIAIFSASFTATRIIIAFAFGVIGYGLMGICAINAIGGKK